MSLPAPLAHAFPHLVAEIDADRPLISAALVDVQVTEITADTIRCNVTTSHSYDLLTSASQYDYLNTVACKHLKLPNAVFIFYNDRPTTAEQDMGELPRPASFSLETTANAPQEPPPPATTNGGPQRNALKIMDRVALIAWMRLPENTEFVAKETDAAAAIKATTDLKIDITAGNIIGIRTNLGIKKFKPEKPADPPADVDLASLQKQFDAIKIDAANTREAYNQLLNHVLFCEARLSHLGKGTALDDLTSEALKPLKPLAPLPVTTTTA